MRLRKVLLSAFAVCAVAVTATTTTYAWFRIGSNAYVNNLDFKVISGLGFKVAVDGTNSAFFTDTLTGSQMTSAILQKYNPDKYVIYKNQLFEKTQISDTETNYRLLDDDEKFELVKESIKLDLATTMKVDGNNIDCDGFTLYNEYGDLITDNTKYLEFDLYFKTDSDLSSDNQHFGIYLTDDTTYNPYGDSKKEADGETNYTESMEPTAIKSKLQDVKLINTMSYLNKDNEVVNLKAKDKIKVNIANAVRISKKDNGIITVTPKPTSEGAKDPAKLDYELDDNKSFTIPSSAILDSANLKEATIDDSTDPQARIYEISNEDNLGSYATTYDGDDDNLKRLYDSNYNAMWTYYNSLGAGSDDVNPLDYEALKAYYDSDIIRNTLSDQHKIVRLDSGLKAHRVTFRFWLEGYDADYFVGVSGIESLKCNLSFKVNSKLL